MKIYDTKLKEKIEFKPLNDGEISMYVCGPTVYDRAHLGHGRSAVSFDVMRRYFEYKGFNVKFVSNYTDIDDKMINRANEEGVAVSALAEHVIPMYEEDYGKLKVKPPTKQPRATEYIEQIVDFVKKLDEKGVTYVIDGDGVYFDVTKFPTYGELSGQSLEDLKMGARVDVNVNKRNPQDFAVWKFKKEGEPFWASPWGDGRPGWHIECSVMSYECLGEAFDIHGGGLDLVFPHHECEVAQSKAVFGADKFAKHWIHNGFIQVDNEKMSKSLGNFFTLNDIFEKYDPAVVRFMFLQTHYRNPINFSDVLLEQAKGGLERLRGFVRGMERVSGEGEARDEVVKLVETAKRFFEFSMDDDFETSGALGAIFDLVKNVNVLGGRFYLNKADSDYVLEFLRKLDGVLGMIFTDEEDGGLDAEVEALIKEREEARANKDFEKSDQIRDELKGRGIELEDTSEGTVWRRL